MRLIDADSILMEANTDGAYGYVSAEQIANAQTIDAAPVRHGRWKQATEPLGWDEIDCAECSECKESFIIAEDFGIDEISEFWHYCPNCGAMMDGE